MVTIREVAEKAKVSISTVSRALSGSIPVDEETKKRILEAVEELNYKPNILARGLKKGLTRTIGLVIPNVRNLVFPAAIKGIDDVARQKGYTVVLCNTDEKLEVEEAHINNLLLRRVDGLIFSTATEKSIHLMELQKKGFPIVLLIRHLGSNIHGVIADNFAGGYRGGEFLVAHGFRRIAFINGDLSLELYRQRFGGFQKALGDHQVALDPELILHHKSGWEDGYFSMLELLDKGKAPEAVFATSDPKAMGVMKAIKERGLKIPEDISVLGYDNLETSQLLDPPLTTIAQPFYEMGQEAARLLIQLIEKKTSLEPTLEVLPVKLVERASVRPFSTNKKE